MSNQSFKVKNSLHLTPQAVEPSGLEVGDLWMDIDGNLKRWDGSASQDVGSGGVGSVDIMFAQTLEQAVIGDFTTTGTVAITETPSEVLQGDKSLKITHTGGASVEQIVEVPAKFRNKNVTLSLDVASDALSGNLTLTVTDETNTVTLINAESIQPQEAGQTSVKRSVSFNVPSDCEELKYKFTAVSESGKISFIDNVVIELTQMSKLDTTIETPIITEWQDYSLVIGATVTAPTQGASSVNKAQWRRVGANMEIRYDYKQTGAGTAGNGTYLFPMPAGYSADTSKLPSGSAAQNIVGVAKLANGTSEVGGTTPNGSVLLSKTFPNNLVINYVQSGETSANVGSGAYPLNSATVGFSFTASLPILGWEATETQSVSLAQTVLVQESDSALRITGLLGYGATNTRVVRFDNASINELVGDAVTYIPSATLGDSFRINKKGIYNIACTIGFQTTTGGAFPYIVKNPSNLLQSVGGNIPREEVIAHAYSHGGASGNPDIPMSATVELEVDDVIWVTNPTASPVALQTGDNRSQIQITYQGSLKQLNVSENQKIEIPTSELRMEGASSRGTGAETFTVKFTNIAKLRGDAFEVDNSNATIITMKKKGRLDISTTLALAAVNQGVRITLNQVTNTANPLGPETLAATQNYTATAQNSLACSVDVNIGDKIRVNSDNNITSGVANSLNLSFQEQEVSVSVTNVLPQFSESDSSVRVDTANGYGSPTGTKIRRFSNTRDNLGSAIEYVPSAVSGDSFLIKESGIYHVSYTDTFAGDTTVAISKNSANLTTNASALANNANNELLAMSRSGSLVFTNVSWQGYLQKDDVIRAHTDGQVAGDNDNVKFTISKVGKPNVTGVDVTPFAKIEYEVTQESYISAGAFNNANVSGSLTSDSNNGLYSYNATTGVYTMLKRARVNVSYNTRAAGAATVEAEIRIDGSKVVGANTQNSIGYNAVASYSAIVEKDQTIAGYSLGSSSVNVIAITATELRDAYQVIGGGVENTYSASIASGATLISQSYPFIASVTSGGTGLYNITYVLGFFNGVIPKVAPTAESSVLPNTPITASVLQGTSTANGVTIRVSQGGTAINFPFVLDVQRQGSDYRTPSKAIGLPAQRIAVLNHELAPTVGSGASTTGVWVTQNLTNIKSDTTGLVTSLASNLVTLPAGRYKISARQMFYGTQDSVLRIFNSTDNTELIVGTGSATSATANDFVTALLDGIITLNAPKQIALQYRVALAGGTYSRGGMASNFGVNIESTNLVIEKIEE